MGSIDSTTENGVDATIDRAIWLGTLLVLHGTVEVLFHSLGKRVDKGLGIQSQLIVNGADKLTIFHWDRIGVINPFVYLS